MLKTIASLEKSIFEKQEVSGEVNRFNVGGNNIEYTKKSRKSKA